MLVGGMDVCDTPFMVHTLHTVGQRTAELRARNGTDRRSNTHEHATWFMECPQWAADLTIGEEVASRVTIIDFTPTAKGWVQNSLRSARTLLLQTPVTSKLRSARHRDDGGDSDHNSAKRRTEELRRQRNEKCVVGGVEVSMAPSAVMPNVYACYVARRDAALARLAEYDVRGACESVHSLVVTTHAWTKEVIESVCEDMVRCCWLCAWSRAVTHAVSVVLVWWRQTQLRMLRHDMPEQRAYQQQVAALAREERAIINVRAAEQCAVLAAWLTLTHLR